MRSMTSSKQVELEKSANMLLQEVDRLTKENVELAKLRQDNIRLQERNVQLAAELSVKTRELELALSSGKNDATNDSDVSDVHDTHENNSCIPGDSYPAVAASLDDIESDVNTDVEELENNDNKKQEPEYLLQKLRKGGNRMDQIKRQLVVQRGAIVAALKILAQSRSGAGGSVSGSMSSYKSSDQSHVSSGSEHVSEEKDRVLVSITAPAQGTSQCKLCPMCEAMFPLGAEEEFEQHVMDHFSYDSDQETLQYLGQDIDHVDNSETDIQTDHL